MKHHSTPKEDATSLLTGMTDEDTKRLVQTGETLLSDGQGNAFLVKIPLTFRETKEIKTEQITIVKIPYSAGPLKSLLEDK